MTDTNTMTKPKCLNPEVIGPDAILPKVDKITCDYYWLALDESIWAMNSMDSDPNMGDMGCLETVLYYKTKDVRYSDLVASILSDGIIDPVEYYPEDHFFGNGHHRLIALIDNGFTHIPYTRDRSRYYLSHGVTTTPGDHWYE